MQTALQRRQRHRRNGAARRGRGGGAARRAALAIPLILFSSFLVLGGVGFVGAVSAYSFYARDLPDPEQLFNDIEFEQPSIVYDRTGTVELARFGVLRRELVEFEDIPEELIDATTAVEDQDFWTNPGFDIGAIVAAGLDTLAGRPRGASTITQQLVRNELLPAWAFEGTVYDRKIREIIQSIRLTEAFPGEQGKKDIIEAYLNSNFYGNQSYGVKAASFGYFGVDLDQLTLAQYAVLAAIPQSPTKFDLMRNAIRECGVEVEEGADCPAAEVTLVVPEDSEIVKRRNYVLDQMKTHSVLSRHKYTEADYEAAKREPLILTPQQAPQWKAPHFVWKVREQLASLLCGPENVETCQAVDTGGYKIITSLDWKMQQTVEKWLYASTRVTHLEKPNPVWERIGIPKSEFGWLRNLRGANIHNGAAAVMDYRTGEILAYGGSGGYYLDSTEKFQAEFDVLSNGPGRQLGSAIKPLVYIVGIDDHTLTASTMFMDVVTDFGSRASGGSFLPTQADGLERGPVRLRPALQFSFNIPAIKAGLTVGLEREFNRWKEFGLTYPPGAIPVVSQSVGSIETHPIELLGAYAMIANGGVKMDRRMILEVQDRNGERVFPTSDAKPVGQRLVSPQAAYIITDILAGNTNKSINPIWGQWQVIEKTDDGNVRRPAAYKTGTTNDRKDTTAFGYLAPPEDPNAPALAVGVWMGNSDNTPNTDALSLASSAPLWSRIMTEISQDLPIARFQDSRPDGLVEVEVDAFTGMLPDPGTVSTVKEIFIKGTEPTRRSDLHVEVQIDAATGRLWQDGCTGPMVTETFLDFSRAEPLFPEWQRYTQNWAERAARGVGVRGGPKGTRTMYFYNLSFHPFGASWGGKFKPTEVCAPLVPCPPPFDPPTPEPSVVQPCFTPEPTEEPTETHPGNGPPTKEPNPTPTPTRGGGGNKTPQPTISPTDNETDTPAQAGIMLVAIAPLLLPLVTLLFGRVLALTGLGLRPARPPSRRRPPPRARPPGPS
ncbi:MAG TPA: transglycosylase domain-containing protein [Candidatus Binatia bacterium]|nr:transglycosylase domain-containing protein [Candidatus Binatia bacterium]